MEIIYPVSIISDLIMVPGSWTKYHGSHGLDHKVGDHRGHTREGVKLGRKISFYIQVDQFDREV